MRMVLQLLLLLPIGAKVFAQPAINGQVVNQINAAPLAYVSIGIANKSVGTVSNTSGQFNLELNNKVTPNDSVVFSCIGYTTAKYAVSALSGQKAVVRLLPAADTLKEIVIAPKSIRWKPRNIGRANKGLGLTHANFYTYGEKEVDDRLSKEMGMKLEIKNNCRVQDLNFYISGNDFSKLKFRVNFYQIKNGLPADLVINKDIVFEIKNNYRGWYKVDLTPYSIYFKEAIGQVAVTIQWLESVKSNPASKYFAIASAASPTHTAFFRKKAMDVWTSNGQSLAFYLNGQCH